MELHRQWGDVDLLQLVEDQTRRPFLDHLEQLQTGAHIGAPVKRGTGRWVACWVGNSLIFLKSNKAKRHDRDTETTRSGKSQPIINRDSQFSNSLGSSKRQGANSDVYVVGRAGRRL